MDFLAYYIIGSEGLPFRLTFIAVTKNLNVNSTRLQFVPGTLQLARQTPHKKSEIDKYSPMKFTCSRILS